MQERIFCAGVSGLAREFAAGQFRILLALLWLNTCIANLPVHRIYAKTSQPLTPTASHLPARRAGFARSANRKYLTPSHLLRALRRSPSCTRCTSTISRCVASHGNTLTTRQEMSAVLVARRSSVRRYAVTCLDRTHSFFWVHYYSLACLKTASCANCHVGIARTVLPNRTAWPRIGIPIICLNFIGLFCNFPTKLRSLLSKVT